MAYRTKLYKSLRCSASRTKEFIDIAAKYGYSGVEISGVRDITNDQARELRHYAEDHGVRIHSISFGWTNLNQPESAQKDLEAIRRGLQMARFCGADAILLVPCKIDDIGVLPASKFKIDFDTKTCLVRRVVEGDNTPYRQYIEKQNEATNRCRSLLEEVIPSAAEEGVFIALENVWSNLWVVPPLMAAFVNSFRNRWIKAYLDLGNNIKYAPVEDWIRAFGKAEIAKIHIKDFICNAPGTTKEAGGKFVPIGQGDINWVSVRNVLEEIGYNGWITLEDVNHFTPEEHSKILDQFFAGNLKKEKDK